MRRLAATILLVLTITVLMADKAMPAIEDEYPAYSSEALAGAYRFNEIAADQKYKGRRFMVYGKAVKVGRTILGKAYVVLAGGDGPDVQGLFPAASEYRLARVREGQTITILGTCTGKTLNILLHDCILVHP